MLGEPAAGRRPPYGWEGDPSPAPPSRAEALLRGALEAGVLGMVCVSPWLFGGTEPGAELFLLATLAVLLVGWAARMLLAGRPCWAYCPVALCLAALVLLAIWQICPLPSGLLHALSPGTVRLYGELLPAEAERLPGGEPGPATTPPAGSTLSLFPARTRHELTGLLAVFLLYALVRSNVASPGSLWRLSLVALVNGVLLSLFAVVQFFTSERGKVYWTWTTENEVFGPFINRNHFAFYLNLCIGLGVGLLLTTRSFAVRTSRARSGRASGKVGPRASAWGVLTDLGSPEPAGKSTGFLEPDASPPNLLQDPAALWLLGVLGLMMASVAFCASRGGVMALLGGWIVVLLINLVRWAAFRRLGAALLTLSLGFGLLVWFGLDRVQARFAALGSQRVFQESRLDLWRNLLPAIREFPIWGTGYGTFEYVEPLYRRESGIESIVTNAENDYLEALVEGGTVRLGISLLAILLVGWLGYRTLRRVEMPAPSRPRRRHGTEDEGPRNSALVLGALFGFATVVMHSVVDFGLHLPAIAVLTTVIAAHLAGAAQGSTTPQRRVWLGPLCRRLVGCAGAVVVVLLGLELSSDGWHAYQVRQLRLEASRVGSGTDSDNLDQTIAPLEAATQLAPDYAHLQIDLAQAHDAVYRRGRDLLRTRLLLAEAAQCVCDQAPLRDPIFVGPARVNLLPMLALASGARLGIALNEHAPLVRAHLVPALRGSLLARALCPLLVEPELYLADNATEFDRADSRATYLERALHLRPTDPAVWYLYGLEWIDTQPGKSWKAWRHSLELSEAYLGSILHESSTRLTPEELCEQVLPNKPKLLLDAACQLSPQPSPLRQPFLDRALSLCTTDTTAASAEELQVQAQLYEALARPAEAITRYQAALARAPNEVTWRLELARLLQEEKRFVEARRELQTVLLQRPDYSGARERLTQVERRIAEGL